MAGQTFYHVSNRPLGIGTALNQGIFGERIRQNAGKEENYVNYLKEEIFEAIRQQHYPSVPSRFNCVFLYPDFNMAKEFYANITGYKTYVYEVEISEGKPFIVEMDLLKCDGLLYQVISSNAHKYWQQVSHPNSGTLEAILEGTAVVKKLLLAPSTIWDNPMEL